MKVKHIVQLFFIFWMASAVTITIVRTEVLVTEEVTLIGMYTAIGLIMVGGVLLTQIVRLLSNNWNRKIF